MNTTYVTLEEFKLFKTMVEEKLFKTDKKPFELAELMMQQFDRLDNKIDTKIDELKKDNVIILKNLEAIKSHLGVKDVIIP